MQIVIGVDPDSTAHGVAYYIDRKLVSLSELTLSDVIKLAKASNVDNDVLFAIEDVKSNNFIYSRNSHQNKNIQSTVARKIGRNQQAQIELERMLDDLGIKYINFKPQKGNWAENKAQFERVTGWGKRSNKDTRSAAFFGYLALNSEG